MIIGGALCLINSHGGLLLTGEGGHYRATGLFLRDNLALLYHSYQINLTIYHYGPFPLGKQQIACLI